MAFKYYFITNVFRTLKALVNNCNKNCWDLNIQQKCILFCSSAHGWRAAHDYNYTYSSIFVVLEVSIIQFQNGSNETI